MENPPVRNVRLYGKLGTKFGRCFRLAVNNPAEAVQALCAQLPGFEKYLMEAKDHGFGFSVFIGKKNIGQTELLNPSGTEDIRIAPVTFGSKNGGWLQIIIGVCLIIIGGLICGFSFGTASPFGTAIAMMGVAMIVGGIVQLLMPVPKGPGGRDSPDDNPSYTFNGPLNTQAQGHPVPLLYGEMVTGSAVVSAGITTEDGSIPVGEGGPNMFQVVLGRLFNIR